MTVRTSWGGVELKIKDTAAGMDADVFMGPSTEEYIWPPAQQKPEKQANGDGRARLIMQPSHL